MGKPNVAVFYITSNGFKLAQRLKGLYPEAEILRFNPKSLPLIWSESRIIIFIMATGIVVRTIAPLIKDKKTDPAVVVLDEAGRFAISLLSAHLGGANVAVKNIAVFLGAKAVITTPSDIDPPLNLVIGIGCHSGISTDEIEFAVRRTLEENGLSFLSVQSIATIDRKVNEPGIAEFARKYGLGIVSFTSDELNLIMDVEKSEIVFKATNAYAVSEPAALLASGNNRLLVPKQRFGNVTVAVAEKRSDDLQKQVPQSQESGVRKKGKIYIVGTGPGKVEHITPYAQKSIRESEVIIGYNTYLDLIKELIKGKQVFSTGMTQESQRCKKAVELASKGKTVAVISGGDAGIYGMAGLVLEIMQVQECKGTKTQEHKVEGDSIQPCALVESMDYGLWTMDNKVESAIEVIPGIPALSACAAKLGAPLTHDFACISLSDRLTHWEIIEKRLEAAASADFVIVLYNPKSKSRVKQIQKAKEIIMKHRHGKTPVGIVKAATRADESVIITNLNEMLNHEINMQTTIIIGNSKSFVWLNWIITPRGYEVYQKAKGSRIQV